MSELRDTSYHGRKTAQRMQDPEFRSAYEAARAEMREPTTITFGETPTGWWVVEGNLTPPQVPAIMDTVQRATEQGKTLVVCGEGVTLRWQPAPDSLDAAWAEAEAAMPAGWFGPAIGPTKTWSGVEAPETKWSASVSGPTPNDRRIAVAATPATALRALASALRERQS